MIVSFPSENLVTLIRMSFEKFYRFDFNRRHRVRECVQNLVPDAHVSADSFHCVTSSTAFVNRRSPVYNFVSIMRR